MNFGKQEIWRKRKLKAMKGKKEKEKDDKYDKFEDELMLMAMDR